MRPDSRLGDRDALLRGPAAPAPEAIADDALFAAFLEMMPLGNRAEDYAVGLRALDSGVQLPDQTAYDRFKAGLDPEWMRSFHKRFYRVRAAMTDADPAAWHRLMEPYPGVTELLRRRAGDALLAVATSKDRRSVGKLLEAYGIADLFPEGRVLDKETGVSKRAHLEHLHGVSGFPYTEMTFVDDKVNHLDAVARRSLRTRLLGLQRRARGRVGARAGLSRARPRGCGGAAVRRRRSLTGRCSTPRPSGRFGNLATSSKPRQGREAPAQRGEVERRRAPARQGREAPAQRGEAERRRAPARKAPRAQAGRSTLIWSSCQ
jgi:phosphoglycolate phosphatase-like HAD superfamily hydrolase